MYEDEHRENGKGQVVVLRQVIKEVVLTIDIISQHIANAVQKYVNSGRYDLSKFKMSVGERSGPYSLRFPKSKVPFTRQEKASFKASFEKSYNDGEPSDHFFFRKCFDKKHFVTHLQISPINLMLKEDTGIIFIF